MTIDGTVLQNITIAITIIVVALVAALAVVVAVPVVRRIIGHNTDLAQAMRDEKEQAKIERAKLADANALLEQEHEQLGELERELSAAKQRIKDGERRIQEMERAMSDGGAAQEPEQQADVVVPMTPEQLMAHIDKRIEELGLHTNPKIRLKDIAKALGLTQRRILQALKSRTDDNT